IMAFSMVLSQGVLWVFLVKDIGFCKPEWQSVRQNIKPIFFLFIPVLAMSVFHIMDKTMVDVLSTEANGGYYYNVDRLVNIPLGLIVGMSTVMLPRISRLVDTKDSTGTRNMLKKSSELSIFLTSAVAFGLGAIANVFVPVFFGKGFEPCILMIEVFVPIIIIKAISDFIRQQFLIPAKKDQLYVIAVVCGAIVNLIANYILILKYNALGAVIGTFLAESVVLAIEVLGSRKEIDFVRLFSAHFAYIIIGLVMTALVKGLESFVHSRGILKLAILICSGGICYMGMCFIYWTKCKYSIFKPYVKKVFNR
nr:polysaccharide biosynthesis C-terminal domain-containing protein [Clostridia bacterium]